MKSNISRKYLDLFLYVFFMIGVIIFFLRNVDKLKSSEISNYQKTKMQLSFDTIINLGKVSSANPISYNGFIKNIGKEKLHIFNLKTSCGCTKFFIENLIILPQDSSKISFNIKPIEKGNDIVNLYFDANTKEENYKLTVKYEAVQK